MYKNNELVIIRRLVLTIIIIMIYGVSNKFIYADSIQHEIYELEATKISRVELNKLSEHIVVDRTHDLSIPDDVLTSIDIDDEGKLLVCFSSKIIVFNENSKPVRAYDITCGKGGFPFAIWNTNSDNIVCMHGDGYEFDEEGTIILEYDMSNETDYKKSEVIWGSKIYMLQNKTKLPLLSTKENTTYSTLIVIDENGNEDVICESIKAQILLQIIHYILVFGAIAAVISIFIRESRKKKLHKLRYGNIKEDESYKRMYVKEKPKIVLSKDSLGRKTQHL